VIALRAAAERQGWHHSCDLSKLTDAAADLVDPPHETSKSILT
jgi:hypothetical protein